MPEIFINGQPVQAERDQTVMQAALANGFYIPYFCWHPNLSVAGNCRICVVEVEDGKGGGWCEIACNMPVSEGMRVHTDSEKVRVRRDQTMQMILLNHPVDCGICDKAGECMLQDNHYAYYGKRSESCEPKVNATKFHPLSERVIIDNERCIFCSRCVRFTHEVSKSCSLGIQHRGDHSLVRASEDGAFARDAYSDNVVDLCPVGALLSKQFLYKSRVWYLKPTKSVCPGCERGCSIDMWSRKPEWAVKSLDAKQNEEIARVTPREDWKVNGPWVCNKARDLAKIFERPRAEQAMLKGKPTELAAAIDAARMLIEKARKPVALVSTWGSNEQLESFKESLGTRFTCFVKDDFGVQAGEVVEDKVLIKPDKNPNGKRARELFGSAPVNFPSDTDLVLVWGEGWDFGNLPRGAKIVYLNSYLAPENGHADVFVPISIQTERDGHYTNFEGNVNGFEACFKAKPGVAHAGKVFAQLAKAGVAA